MLHFLNEAVREHDGVNLIINDDNRDALNAVHKYLCCPTRQTGIMLYGPVGTGKSVIMQAFRKCMRVIWQKGLVEYNAPYIRANYYKEQGEDFYSVSYKLHLFKHLVINDIGFERPYSSGEDIIQTVMFDRFERGYTTHGTTNLKPEEFITRYNDDKDRMMDRFRIMFQFVEIKGESFR